MAGRPLKAGQGALADIPILSDSDKIAGIVKEFFGSFAPSEDLWLDEWADLYRGLAQESSFEFGRWKTSRFPFGRRIMRCLSPQSRAKEVAWIKGAQVSATEIMINWIMYIADVCPGPVMYIQGTDEAARDFSTQKLFAAINATPKVARTLGIEKEAAYVKSALRKGFPGGHLTLGGSRSPDLLRSKSLAFAAIDEEDTFPINIGGVNRSQGSPIEMLKKRLSNFPFSKIFRASTPTIKETSTIEPAFLAGSQEYYYLPCPFCNPEADSFGSRFVLEWRLIKWSKDAFDIDGQPKEVWCTCPCCGERIFEYHKTWMLDHGIWLSSKGSECGELYEVGDVRYPSFHISSFYSPLGFFSWNDAVRDWLQYDKTKDTALLQVIRNQCWGETWSAVGSDISYNLIQSRCEHYIREDTGEVVDVPSGGLVLTAGVDVQDDRLEVEVLASGRYDETWSVDYAVLYGPTEFIGDRQFLDPNTGQPTVWGLLADYLDRKWIHASGQEMPIECTLVDTGGHMGEQVHAFCRMFEHRRIYPSKGQYGWGKAKGFFTRPKRRTDRFKTLLFILYPDELKEFVYNCLSIDTPGPGYCHFPDTEAYGENYFKGLTIENKRTKMVNGRTVLYWENPSGGRNEPLDCRCMALAARHIYGANLDRRAQQERPIMPVVAPKRATRRVSPGLGV